MERSDHIICCAIRMHTHTSCGKILLLLFAKYARFYVSMYLVATVDHYVRFNTLLQIDNEDTTSCWKAILMYSEHCNLSF